MHEMECVLHEYLSFNWDRTDEIYSANDGATASYRLSKSNLLMVVYLP